jgi:Uma2 family endonuclease
MADMARKYDEAYTYNDYLEIDDNKRYELVDGELYMMSSPSSVHQEIVGEVYGQLREKLMGRVCTPFVSPMDVRLFYEEDGSDDTIVQPDVFVICDRSKIGKNSINGAPDFVVEVLSPSNSAFELSLKQSKYELAGVREYWMIDPDQKMLLMYVLSDKGVFRGDKYPLDGIKNVASLGVDIDMDAVSGLIDYIN